MKKIVDVPELVYGIANMREEGRKNIFYYILFPIALILVVGMILFVKLGIIDKKC